MDKRYRSLGIDASRFGVDEDGSKVYGYAAVFDQWAVISRTKGVEHREIIRRTAFDRVLADQDDVLALVEHDDKRKLGRVRSGTLRLSVDDYGLRFEVDLANTTVANDLREDIRHRNITGASFGYLPRPNGETLTPRVEGGRRVVDSEITDAYVFDVSPVADPAYVGTSVGLRSARLDGRVEKRIMLAACVARLHELGLRD